MLKIVNSKFKKSQTWFCLDHWEENSGEASKLLALICRRGSVLKFSLPLGPMLTKTNKNRYKRPRGFDALLGHLLGKTIPVTFQLSSTKIPEYLSQK